MPQMIDRTDFILDSTVEGFGKHRWELLLARQDSPIAREIMSEIGRAKDSFLEVLQGAEVDQVSDMAQKSFLSVLDTDFGL